MTTETIGRTAVNFGQRTLRGVAIAGLLALTLGACETTQEAANWTSRQYNAVASGGSTNAAYSPGDYSATGIASWYPRKAQGRRTSSGDRVNHRALTAAHRTLPVGTKVRVTNLRNRRSIVVTINDNRMWNKRRVIQLSRGAARKLGVFGKKPSRRRVRVDSLG